MIPLAVLLACMSGGAMYAWFLIGQKRGYDKGNSVGFVDGWKTGYEARASLVAEENVAAEKEAEKIYGDLMARPHAAETLAGTLPHIDNFLKAWFGRRSNGH